MCRADTRLLPHFLSPETNLGGRGRSQKALSQGYAWQRCHVMLVDEPAEEFGLANIVSEKL